MTHSRKYESVRWIIRFELLIVNLSQNNMWFVILIIPLFVVGLFTSIRTSCCSFIRSTSLLFNRVETLSGRVLWSLLFIYSSLPVLFNIYAITL